MNRLTELSFRPVFAPNDGAGAGGGAGTDEKAGEGKEGEGAGGALDFDTWIGKQDDATKGLLENHTKGLKTALENERGTKKDLEKQIRDLATKAEKGSEAEKNLTEIANKLETSNRQTSFYEAAHAAGVTNLRLAWQAAIADDLFHKRDGSPDIEALKKAYPELFSGNRRAESNAGSGAGAGGGGNPTGMNGLIRRAAGQT